MLAWGRKPGGDGRAPGNILAIISTDNERELGIGAPSHPGPLDRGSRCNERKPLSYASRDTSFFPGRPPVARVENEPHGPCLVYQIISQDEGES